MVSVDHVSNMSLPLPPAFPCSPDLVTWQKQILAARDALIRARQELDIHAAVLDQAVVALGGTAAVPSAPHLFASPPVTAAGADEQLTIEYLDEGPPSDIVLEATQPAPIEQHLEQATLDELNQALAKAFSQVSGRLEW